MKNLHAPLRALVLALVIAPSLAQQERRVAVTDIKPLLRQAIGQGSAHGVLTGGAAAYARERFDASTPIHVDVVRLHPLAGLGCHRLEVKTRQQGVLEGVERADKELAYQLSYCLDGSLPSKE
jgi:hypothetical protein